MTSLMLLALAALSAPQDGFEPVPQSLMAEIGQVLPERSNAGASFVTTSYSPNVSVSEPANIDIVLLWEGAGYRNSLGYFTYREEPSGAVTILDSNLVVADASFPSAGLMQTGDRYRLRHRDGTERTFQAGDRVGFFVVADGWNSEPRIRSWSAATTGIPGSTPAENAGIGRGCYTTVDRLNPERLVGALEESRHVAMLWFPPVPGFLEGDPFLVTGVEDLNRTSNSDDDFNDIVFVVTANPIGAIEDTPVLDYVSGDPDGDGVLGADDHFPGDPERAFVTRTPSHGETVLAFEDQYPGIGDADFNDAVFAHHFEVVTDAAGAVKDVLLTGHLVARGAGYDHAVSLHLPGLPAGATGAVDLERFLSDGSGAALPVESTTVESLVAAGRVKDVVPSTRAALPPIAGATFTNTQFASIDRPAASSRLRITFDQAVDPASLGGPPYDLHFAVLHGAERWDVHRPGVDGLADRPAHLPVEAGPLAFVAAEGRPWVLEIPTSWRFPREQVRVWNAYPEYSTWAASAGSLHPDWYERPTATPGFVGFQLSDYVPERTWSFGVLP